MIRPLTVATFLMACGSGLYLYQSKHEVQLLDRQIEKTVHDTNALREQSRLLATEWTMLNDPDRLRQFSDMYLNLKPISPTQFTSLADLGNRLPPPRVEAPAASGAEAPVAAESAPPGEPEAAPATAEPAGAGGGALPVPPPRPISRPAPPPAPAVAAAARPAEVKVAASRPAAVETPPRASAEPHVLALRAPEQRVPEQRLAEQRVPEQRAVAHLAETHPEVRLATAAPPRPILLAGARPHPANSPVASQPVAEPLRPVAAAAPVPALPYGGSLLGMAHGSYPPAPRPVPLSASFNTN